MRRAIVALGVSAALVAGAGAAAYAAGTAAGGNMHDRMTTMDVKSMDMGTMDMGTMDMQGADMDAMHARMREAMPAEMTPACDAAHAEMAGEAARPDGASAEGTPTATADHAAHHTDN